MALVSTLSDTVSQKGLKGLDGSVKISQVRSIVERLKDKDIFKELLAKGQSAYGELMENGNLLDEDPHAIARYVMRRKRTVACVCGGGGGCRCCCGEVLCFECLWCALRLFYDT